jgi:hypothetical protein
VKVSTLFCGADAMLALAIYYPPLTKPHKKQKKKKYIKYIKKKKN